MGINLSGISVSVVGGDKRDLYLIAELVRLGATVTTAGFPASPELVGSRLVCDLTCLQESRVVVLPVPGTDQEGRVRTLDPGCQLILTEEVAGLIRPGTLVIIGVAREFLRRWAATMGWKLVEIVEMDMVAVLNAIPSAEGAIQIAMEELPITIHNSNSFVLGFGRLGKTLARMLQGVGARTTVVARKERDLARIFEQGYRHVTFKELSQVISEAEIIFNTVPARVLDRQLLSLLQLETLIIDLAAAPGGTDFAAASELGIRALLAPGLPGNVAPKTSGKILAQVIPQLILNELTECPY